MSFILQEITSSKNPKVQHWKNLHKRSFRLHNQQFLIEGVKMIEEAYQSNWEVLAILLDSSKLEGFLPLVSPWDIPTFSLSSHVFKSLSNTKSPQGMMAVVAMKKNMDLSSLGDRLVVLDQVQDPGNVGTLLRTADAAGFTGILLSFDCADIYSAKTLRSTMGSIFHLPFLIVQDLPAVLKDLNHQNFSLIGSRLGADDFFSRSPIFFPFALVIGNEGNGISPQVLSQCQYHYSLPMEGKAESLNASVAGGIMMYDLIRFDKTLA